jgi:hypothetical protein
MSSVLDLFYFYLSIQLCSQAAIKLHTVGTNKTNLKHYSCVSGQNHFTISTHDGGNNANDRQVIKRTVPKT